MAESAVSFVIDKLTSFLSQEVELLKGVHEEVAKIKDDLEAIRAFLQDADLKAEKEGISQGVKLWVKQAREVAFQLQDVIDRYMLLVARHHDRHGFGEFLRRISAFVKQLRPRHEIASELQQIREVVREVKNNVNNFQLIPSAQGAERGNARNVIPHDPRLSSLAIEEAELVGIESSRNELISLLVEGPSQRKVISVVGLGGAGKTTIARKVYDNHFVKNHFERCAWITVSQSYDPEKLLRSILQGFCGEKKEDVLTMDAALLTGELKGYLRAKRFLVVFDDVWDPKFWGDVEHALLDNDNGSRILFTTRNENVVNSCRRSSLVDVYQIKLLTDEEAWELFCKKTFKFEADRRCPRDLEELSRNIVRRCGGLPLAIATIGGVLAIKEKKVPEWERVLNNLGSAIAGDQDLEHISKILSLSYSDLPYNLKSCFLYLGMFPEDFSIRCGRLISLWVAGGFVQEKRGMALEEVAEEYLIELIHRSLVQLDKPSLVKRIPKSVRVHDLIRDVILSKSEELNFCHVSSARSDFRGIARHLSFSNRASDNQNSITKSQTRSVIVFDDELWLRKPIFATSKLLTTLDFERCSIFHIPREIGKLLHLRYLNLRKTGVLELPKSIEKLHNLQYVLGGRRYFGMKTYCSIGHLELLRTLNYVRCEKRLLEELGSLKQLRKLGIIGLKGEDGRDLCISLQKMTNLRSLFLKGENLQVQSLSSPPLHLQTVSLEGNLERLPKWISKLYNLSELRLMHTNLKDDPIKILQSLPNLASLDLWSAYNGEKMHFEERGFRQLKYLGIIDLNGLNTMVIDKGAMPFLEELSIEGCRQLNMVPSGIQHLKGLKTLRVALISREFMRRLLSRDLDFFKRRLSSRDQDDFKDGGEDYWMVKHVPNIYFNGELLSRPNDEIANDEDSLKIIDITGESSNDPHP